MWQRFKQTVASSTVEAAECQKAEQHWADHREAIAIARYVQRMAVRGSQAKLAKRPVR
jgi:hypothetical protein